MDNIKTASEMMLKLFENIDRKELEKNNKLLSSWKKILSKIKKYDSEGKEIEYGSFLLTHSKIVDLKKGILFVEADHSGWIQILQIYSSFILKSLKKELPELKINSISIKASS